ncbi:MAG: hypothetical protein H3C64_06630 [Candidatus Kuenenia stuttgartiensis]|nr:hypothetical protein [Candidatus Kuenenia stuttgartiensis]
MLDQLFSFCDDNVTSADVNYVLGYIDDDKIYSMFECFVNKDTSGALRIVDDILNEGKTPAEFIDQLLLRLRDLLVFSSCGQEAVWAEYDESFIQRFEKSFSGDTLMYMIQMLSVMRIRSTDSLLQRISAEMAIIKLCRMESIDALSGLIERITTLEEKLEQVDNIPGKRGSAILLPAESFARQTVSEKSIEEGDVIPPAKEEKITPGIAMEKNEVWGDILKSIQKKKKSTWAFFKEGRLVSSDAGVLVVAFPRKFLFQKERLEQPEEKKLIENCAKEVVPGFMELKLVLSEKEEPEENRQSQSLDNGGAQQINDTVFSEPAVKKTLELFDGRVIKVNR